MAKEEVKAAAADKAVNLEKLKALQLTIDKIEKLSFRRVSTRRNLTPCVARRCEISRPR